MAENKSNDCEMNGEDFSQDVTTSENENGGSTGTEAANGNNAENSATNGNGADGGENENGNEASANNIRDDDRKLFVGGLSWETSEKELREHFGKFGEIESINVKTDPTTGRSRGFAFIVFTTTDAIDKVNEAPEHIINSKKVDPKKAKARHGKIFVGGLTNEISDDEIKAYFSQFGNIVDVEMPFDKQKAQRKGFCFITFDSEPVVNELLKTPKQKISGREVDVKRATPKPDNQTMAMRAVRGGMRGGRNAYGGRGGYPPQWASQTPYPNYGSYGSGYDTGYGDYYGGGGFYNSYDYGYDYGYGGSGYDGGYSGSGYSSGGGGGRSSGGPRGGPKGSGGYQSGKQRGTGRQPRHQPY